MTQRTTKAQRREWHERVTAMPTRADIDRCIECWPKGWEDKCAFRNGQVATLLAEVERQRADNERLRAREAALVAVVERVAASADGNMVMCLCGKSEWLPSATTVTWRPMEQSTVTHTPDCVFAQARALLAAGEQAPGEA